MANRIIDATLRFVDKFTGPMQNALGSMNKHANEYIRAGKKIERAGKNITKTGSTLTKSLTLPIVGLGTAAITTAANFEAGMSKVQSICGASEADMDKLTAKAKEMGSKTKFSATESADAFSYMAMAGWKTQDMLDGIEGIMYLAGATGEDLASTSDIVTDALTAFGMTAKDTNKFVDVLAKTANSSNTNVSMLGEAFKYAAPSAGALGYSAEDVATALGMMANSGIKASQAGTSLNSWFTRMAKPTKESSAAMKELGISMTDSEGKMKPFGQVMQETRGAFAKLTESEKAQYAAMLAGKTGMSGLLAVVNASEEDFNSLAGSIANSSGAAQEMYQVANNNLNGKLTVLKSTVESIAITFGEKLAPTVGKLTDKLQKFADKLNGMSDEQVESIIKVAGAIAAIGPGLMVFGKMVTGIGSAVTAFGRLGKSVASIGKAIKTAGGLGKAISSAGGLIPLLTGPVGVAVAVVAGLIVVLVLLVKNWDKVKAAGKKFGNWMKSVFKACGFDVKEFAKSTKESFSEFAGKAKELWTIVEPVVTKIGQYFAIHFKVGIVGAIGAVIGFITSAMKSCETVFGGIMKYFSGFTEFLSGVFTHDTGKMLEGLKTMFSGAFQALVGIVKAPLNAVIGLINGAIAGINKMHIKIPDWVPKPYGGKEFKIDIPTIPLLAKGTKNWIGGPAMIHDKGAEIVDLPKGSRVYPHDESIRMAAEEGRKSAYNRNIVIEKISILANDAKKWIKEPAMPKDKVSGILDFRRSSTMNRNETITKQRDDGKRTSSQKAKVVIEKLCDQIIVRNDDDIDKIADALAKKLEEAALNME